VFIAPSDMKLVITVQQYLQASRPEFHLNCCKVMKNTGGFMPIS